MTFTPTAKRQALHFFEVAKIINPALGVPLSAGLTEAQREYFRDTPLEHIQTLVYAAGGQKDPRETHVTAFSTLWTCAQMRRHHMECLEGAFNPETPICLDCHKQARACSRGRKVFE